MCALGGKFFLMGVLCCFTLDTGFLSFRIVKRRQLLLNLHDKRVIELFARHKCSAPTLTKTLKLGFEVFTAIH
jgi:hypothetical protein